MWDHAGSKEERIRFVCKLCYFHLCKIPAIHHILTSDATEKLMHASMTSKLDSCN